IFWHILRLRFVRFAGSRPAGRPARSRRFRPELLPLEERVVPQATTLIAETAAGNGSIGTAQPLPDGAPVAVTGSIGFNGDNDYYIVDAPAGAKIWAYVDTGGPQAPGATGRNSQLTLFRSNGTVIQDNDDGAVANGGDGTVESSTIASALSAAV